MGTEMPVFSAFSVVVESRLSFPCPSGCSVFSELEPLKAPTTRKKKIGVQFPYLRDYKL